MSRQLLMGDYIRVIECIATSAGEILTGVYKVTSDEDVCYTLERKALGRTQDMPRDYRPFKAEIDAMLNLGYIEILSDTVG